MNLHTDLSSTYSIVARDPDTEQLGVAVQTHQMGVGSHIIWMRPGLGAAITQAFTNISFGPMALAMLAEGLAPARIIAALAASDAGAEQRQVAVVDAQGRAAAWTGSRCIRAASHHVGTGYTVQANMMTHPTVVPAMAEAFEKAVGDLAQRMVAALEAAQAAGGDIRGMQSAALKVVPGDRQARVWASDYDLRVDEHAEPLQELGRLVRLRRSQIVDDEGFKALAKGNRDEALALWTEARELAPELEETAYWQAITLADEQGDIAAAAAILRPMLAADPRRAHWIDLTERLVECGVVKHKEAAEALLAAVR